MFELKSTYLNTAYMGPMPLGAKAKVEQAVREALDPAFSNFEERLQVVERVRAKFAKLLGVSPQNIALGGSVSEMVGHVANGLELHQGDNVVLMQGDYPSMVLPWMVMAELKGFQIHFCTPEEFTRPESLPINDRTRFVGCSHVMFNSGAILPINHLGRHCRNKGVLFMADTSQSLGAVEVDTSDVDILVGVAYKWLLGPYGTAYGYFNATALKEVRRTQAAWLVSANMKSTESLLDYTTEVVPGARRFDRGQSPTYLLNAALEGALDVILEKGLHHITAHNVALAHHFVEGLPKNFKRASSTVTPIVCFKDPARDSATLKRQLAQKNIDVSLREGFLRASFHLFNTRAQVDDLLAAL